MTTASVEQGGDGGYELPGVALTAVATKPALTEMRP